MNKALKDLPFATAYLHDIIICSKTIGDHLGHLKSVLFLQNPAHKAVHET